MAPWQEVIGFFENNAIADAMRENDLLFPLVESVHVLAITLVVGSIAVVDLRLLGFASAHRPVGRVTNAVLPITWIAFVIAVIAGGLLFIAHASKYLANGFFVAKMALIAAAGANMILFHIITAKNMQRWDKDMIPAIAARLAGGTSLLLWAAVVACGRWIGFTMPVD